MTLNSLVAVHGLSGNRIGSWSLVKDMAGEKTWLEALLPDLLPKARIMTFGYDRDILRDESSSATVLEAEAGRLLEALRLRKVPNEVYL